MNIAKYWKVYIFSQASKRDSGEEEFISMATLGFKSKTGGAEASSKWIVYRALYRKSTTGKRDSFPFPTAYSILPKGIRFGFLRCHCTQRSTVKIEAHCYTLFSSPISLPAPAPSLRFVFTNNVQRHVPVEGRLGACQ